MPHDIIGHKAYVDLPEAGIAHVPAKIDTGADYSAIWASNIKESNGELTFQLFGGNSVYSTGETIRTRDYSEISVRNSFGRSELRYRVVLATRIGGKIIKANYTLADRSRNSTPILIGRKTLSGKFLVDVKKKVEPRQRKVLIVSKIYSEEVARFAQRATEKLTNAVVHYTTYDDMIISFRNGHMSVYVDSLQADLASYDIVHFKTSTIRDITASLARYALSKGVSVPDAEVITGFPTMSKLYEYTLLTLNKILIPDTLFMTPEKTERSYDLFVEKLGLPFVLKDIHGSKGNFNAVIRNEDDFRSMLASVNGIDIFLIGQKFTPNEGDYRILIMGNRIELIIYRQRVDDTTHLNNTTQGGKATLVHLTDLPPAVRRASLLAAKLMGRDIAGVDMVQDSLTKRWYCFEVNDGPQIVTGAFLEEKLLAFTDYINRMLEKRI